MMCPQIFFETLLVISISGIIFANSPPLVNFGPASGTILVQENFKIGEVLFSITASDPDNQPLSFSMVNAETTSLVYLSQPNQTNNIWKSDVILKTQLDRDRSPNIRTLVFSVTDGQLVLQGRVSLTIRDVNDNPPMFTKLPYRISLPENTTINQTMFVATAADVDDGLGGTVLFSMAAQAQGATSEYNTTFVLANENYGNITLRRQLDYETQTYYQYQIFAKDRGSSPCPGPTCLCSNITEPNVNCAGEPAIFSVTVIDVQDTPPFFTGLPYLASVYENETLGHNLFQVNAMDGDRGVPNDVIYSIADNKYFMINNTTGEITLKFLLDADVPDGQNFILSVTATEVDTPGQLQQGETHQMAQVFISVFDVNDNAPVFTRENYTASMKNSTPRGAPLTLIGIIEVTDRDRGENSLFSLSVEMNGYPYPAFETVPQTGTVVYGTTTIAIRVNDSSLIGQERKSTITFQIVARETGTLELFETRANIIVTIEDDHWSNTCDNIGIMIAANSPPVVNFGPFSGTVLVQESFRIRDTLFKITASDSDSPALTFSMENDETKSLVYLSQPTQNNTSIWEVDVLLKTQLDRDRSPNTRTLVFSVTDGQLSIYGRVSLTIRDVNDNPPMFTNLPYRISLPENSTIDEVVFIATAEDVDDGQGGEIVFSMMEQTNAYNKTFVLENEKCGNITLKRQLDYETQPYYQFQIFIKDRGSPPCPSDACLCNNITEPKVNCAGEPAIFSVAVTDVQDTPPFFTGLPYLAYVHENATIGHSLFKVNAMDGDRGVPNDVTYSLADNRYFIINNKTGEITLNSSLDADEPGGQNFILSVMAEEIDKSGQTQLGNTSVTTQVAVTVYDVNDNGPEFSDANYTAYVQENTPQGVPLTIDNIIYVNDKDQGSNSVFKLSVEKDGELYTDFETLPKTNVTGTTTVTIRVLNSSALDYEKVQTITFQIVAREVSTAELNSSYTNVTVYIEDMNDNTPVFANDTPRSINATEHSPNGTVLANISATDADSRNYSTISYSLEDTYDGKFNISSDTGQLMVAADINREDASTFYSLVVVATDNMAGDDTNRRSSRHNVRVNVTDINDSFPEFQSYSPNVIVQENARVLTTIMTLTAVDKDAEHNGIVEYSIVQDSTAALNQTLFDINSTTGVLFVSESLIGHSGFHNLTVMAHDLGVDQKNRTISVLVNVEDVNLNEPIFVVPDETIYNVSKGIIPNITVCEGISVRTLVIKLNATDGDIGGNGDVTYNIDPDLGEDYRFFDVGTFNGCLINTQSLDREKREWYQRVVQSVWIEWLVNLNGVLIDTKIVNPLPYTVNTINIKAEDSGSPNRLSKVIPFRIVLKDINDNEPYFPLDDLPLQVKEEENNVPVGNVSVAKDKDSDPENRVICYYLYGGLEVNNFLLHKNNGTLILLTKLDTEVTQSVEIYVKTSGNCSFAEDYFLSKDKNNSFNSSDDTLLKVTVGVDDINDNLPVFDKNALTTAMLFDIEVETPIFDLKTYTNDSDTSPINRDNSFSLVGPITASADIPAGIVPGSFEVSPNGSVITKKLFSSNLVGYFILPVQVIDKNNQNDTATLKIYLVGNENRIRIVFNKQPNEVQERKAPFLEELSRALNMDIIADKITTHTNSDGASDTSRTDMYIHARSRPSGEIIESDELWKQIDFNADVRFIFQEYGVLESRPVGEKIQASTEVTVMEKSFIIVSICLGVICIVLVIVFINTTQRYRRKLRAATTSSYVREKHAPDVFVPPGTNQYKASNPLYGREVLPIDVDRLSQDSLDMNVVDEKLADDMPKNEDQEICMQIFDDDDEPRGGRGYPSHNLNSFIQEHEIGISGEFNASTSALTLSTRSAEPTDRKLRGHVKSDSGYTEHTMFDSLTDYEYTDI